MSSSRSIAAARNRRAGDSGLQAKMPSKQPVTSISSQRAFLQNPDNNNVSNTNVSATKNSLPFSKLTVSDAVGLITLRLGKVEQFLIDMQNNDNTTMTSSSKSGIDNSVLTTIINRLDALEKKEINNPVQESIKNLTREVASIKQSIQLLNKNTETFKSNVNAKFGDIELAFVELEKNMDKLNKSDNSDEHVDIENEEICVTDIAEELKVENNDEVEHLVDDVENINEEEPSSSL
jgi:hypothetical protein